MATPVKALPRLKAQYRAEISKKLAEEFGFKNPHQIPNLTKIVVNMGVGAATQEKKHLETAAEAAFASRPVRDELRKRVTAAH